jgi:hypothetical protein
MKFPHSVITGCLVSFVFLGGIQLRRLEVKASAQEARIVELEEHVDILKGAVLHMMTWEDEYQKQLDDMQKQIGTVMTADIKEKGRKHKS